MSDLDGLEVVPLSESSDSSTVRAISDPGMPALRWDQARALRACPREDEPALENGAGAPPLPDGSSDQPGESDARAVERNAHVAYADETAS